MSSEGGWKERERMNLQKLPSGYKKSKKSMGKEKQNNFLKLSIPGMGFLRKFQQYRRLPQEPPTHHLEEELDRLTSKIDCLLSRIDGQDLELATSQEEECVVCGTNKATMQTLPCAHRVVCRQCFVRTIQMAVAQKRLPLRCILCRAKVLRLQQDGAKDKESVPFPKSVSGYNIAYNISSSASNYSFTSGISAVSSESSSSRKSSLVRDFSFSSLSNFQNVNLLNKSQIPRSKSGSFSSRRNRRSRSPSPAGPNRSRSVEAGPPKIKIDGVASDECLFVPSPVSPTSPGLPLPKTAAWGSGPKSPRSPTSPTSPISPGDADRMFSSRGGSRLSTPLSPIKESRKEMGSLAELDSSPARDPPIKLHSVPKKTSSRIRCAEKILNQLESDGSSWTPQGESKKNCCLKKLSEEDIACLEGSTDQTSTICKVKTSKSVSFKDC